MQYILDEYSQQSSSFNDQGLMSLTLDENNHWLEAVRRVESPNCDERPGDCPVQLIVMHGISLPPNEYGGPYIDQLFTNTLNKDEHPYFAEIIDLRVSAHVMINRQGEITQYVPFNKRAWHAGKSLFNGRENCNDFSIGIEMEGCDDSPYEEAQYQQAAELIRLLRQIWPDLTHDQIKGHADIAPGRKTDPGEAFNWEYFYSLLD